MKRAALFLMMLAGLTLTGCGAVKNNPAELAFARSVRSFGKLMVPRYKAYLAADTKLAPESKAERGKTATEFMDLVEQRYKHLLKSTKK